MRSVLPVFEQRLPDALQFLEQMVSMESPSFDKVLVDKFGRFVGSRFSDIGGRVEYVPAERFGDHLVVRFGKESTNRVLLLGHIDTVWSAGELEKRPFQIENNRATGPGVFDMKAGILLMWMALQTMPDADVTIILNSDEEVGSNSSRGLIEAEAGKCRAALVLEPSLPGGVLKTTRKGVGGFTIKAIGRAAHAGIDPERGIYAIEELSHQILKLQKMSDASRGTTVTVAVIKGGTRSNVVPAEAAVEVDIRLSSLQEAERIISMIQTLSPELPGARLEIRGGITRPPMERTSETARLFEVARAVATELGFDLQEGATGGASDGNFTAALGVPTLDGLGAVGGGAHAVDEWVDIPSLPFRAALIAGLLRSPNSL
jgi:glutamate carboxypeptidase